MDQNNTSTTPRGGPQPKRANYGRPFLNDSNIEQTLFDATNTNFTRQFNGTPAKSSASNYKLTFDEDENNDSLDDLSFVKQAKSAKTPTDSKNLSFNHEDPKNTSNVSSLVMSPGLKHPNTPCESDSKALEQTLEPEVVKNALEKVPGQEQSFVLSPEQQKVEEDKEETQFLEDVKNISIANSLLLSPQRQNELLYGGNEEEELVEDPKCGQETPRQPNNLEFPEEVNNSSRFVSFVLSPHQQATTSPRHQYDTHQVEDISAPELPSLTLDGSRRTSLHQNYTLSTIQEDATEQLKTPMDGKQKLGSANKIGQKRSFVESPEQKSVTESLNTPERKSAIESLATPVQQISVHQKIDLEQDDLKDLPEEPSFIMTPKQQNFEVVTPQNIDKIKRQSIFSPKTNKSPLAKENLNVQSPLALESPKINTSHVQSLLAKKSSLVNESPKINTSHVKSALELASENKNSPLYGNSFITSPRQQSPQVKETPKISPKPSAHQIESPVKEIDLVDLSRSCKKGLLEVLRGGETPGKVGQEDSVMEVDKIGSNTPKFSSSQKSNQNAVSRNTSFAASPSRDAFKHSITIFDANVIAENTMYPSQEKANEKTTVDLNATLSDFVEVSTLVKEIVEAEVPTDAHKIDNFSDKLSGLDFMFAEYAVAILNRQAPRVKMSEISENLGDCVRHLIDLVNDSNKSKFSEIQTKDRSDFEYTLNLERQKQKNGQQEREMLCTRINELEQREQQEQLKNKELQEELERCMESLDEADSLEAELLKYKKMYNELKSKK